MEMISTEEALNCLTLILILKLFRKCLDNSMENMHTDVGV